jgi:hypothetical protein
VARPWGLEGARFGGGGHGGRRRSRERRARWRGSVPRGGEVLRAEAGKGHTYTRPACCPASSGPATRLGNARVRQQRSDRGVLCARRVRIGPKGGQCAWTSRRLGARAWGTSGLGVRPGGSNAEGGHGAARARAGTRERRATSRSGLKRFRTGPVQARFSPKI